MNELIQIIRSFSRPIEPLPTGVPIDLHPLDGIETVLFDVYGTLLVAGSGDIGSTDAAGNSEALTQALIASGYEGDCARAGELGPGLLRAEIEQQHDAARQNGIESPEVEISMVWKKVIEKFQALEILRPDGEAKKIRRLAVEYECRVNPVWPMPGALEMIGTLRARGFRLGIISNAQFYTVPTLEALFGKPVEALGFDPALCVWSYQQLRSKPSVELFRTLEKEIDLTKTVYVGNDMLNDIWTAAQAGCRTVLFAGDRRALRLREQDSRCKKLKPDTVINDLRQITEIV